MRSGIPIICYGAGKWASDNKNLLPSDTMCFCDKDQTKHGTSLYNYPIYSLQQGFELYPDAKIFLSVGTKFINEILQYLCAIGIERERILLNDDTEQHAGCVYLERIPWITIGGAKIKVVSEYIGELSINRVGDLQQDFEKIERNRQNCRKKSFLQSDFNCNDCFVNAFDFYPSKVRNVDYNIVFESNYKDTVCNARCVYCTAYDERRYAQNVKSENKGPAFIDDWRKIKSMFVGKKLFIGMANGEMTISPWKDEVIKDINESKWEILVPTNCFIYNNELAKIAADGRAIFIFSLDAGTPETFKRIKGFDKFNRCISNIKEYLSKCKSSDYHCLKYLLLENINDNQENFDGFIDVAKKLCCPVMISNDNFTLPNRMSITLKEKLLLFIDKLRTAGIWFDFGRATFQSDDYMELRQEVKK
ncbi:hypothetical protein AGMMS49938_17720 [Fibrobacterales bacterium]|nr:hypothetical protein AGMMS49938_17720 [Fibrobacterales bacterium]